MLAQVFQESCCFSDPFLHIASLSLFCLFESFKVFVCVASTAVKYISLTLAALQTASVYSRAQQQQQVTWAPGFIC